MNNKLKINNKKIIKTSLISLGVVVMILNKEKLSKNFILERSSYALNTISDASPFLNVISDVKELEKYYQNSISFEELRTTLANNQFINEHYRLYCNLFIDSLETNFPDINLILLNEHLKDLQIATVSKEELNENVLGQYDMINNIIKIKEGFENTNSVIFHELVHCTRLGSLQSGFVELQIDYRISKYGNAFNEAFTELTANYLSHNIGKDYFNSTFRTYRSYNNFVSMLYQILKLVEGEYTMYDFFNQDVDKLKKVLSKYDLEELIILYDIDLEVNGDNNLKGKEKIKELELKLLHLRTEQELKKGTSISEIYLLANSFFKQDRNEVINEITSVIEKKGIYPYLYLDVATSEDFMVSLPNGDELFSYYNPKIQILYNEEIIYNNTLYKTPSKYLIGNLYIYASVTNDILEYKICKFESDKYIDIVTEEEIKSTSLMYNIGDFINTSYNCKINLNEFVKSDIIVNDLSLVNEHINELIYLQKENTADFEIYDKFLYYFNGEGIELCNNIMNDYYENGTWNYRLTDNRNIKLNQMSLNENCEGIQKEVEIDNPTYKIYYNGKIIYENNVDSIKEGNFVDLYIVTTIENNESEYKLARYCENYFDILTGEQVECIGKPLPLEELINSNYYDIEINLNNFLNSDFIQNKLFELNGELKTNQKVLKR